MRYILFIVGFQLLIFNTQAQTSETKPNKLAAWLGTWKGMLQVNSANGKNMNFPMTLNIQPTDTSNRYSWTIVYGEGSSMQIRPYELLDKGNDRYIIDEKNSIVLDAYMLGNTLVTRFEVKGSLLMITYQLHVIDKQIIFRVYSGKNEAIKETGGQKNVPIVKTYPLNVVQEAYLNKNR